MMYCTLKNLRSLGLQISNSPNLLINRISRKVDLFIDIARADFTRNSLRLKIKGNIKSFLWFSTKLRSTGTVSSSAAITWLTIT